jgi:hypothetical protein
LTDEIQLSLSDFTKKNILGKCFLDYLCAALRKAVLPARVAELVDALDSKSSDSNIVRVRFPPRVLFKILKPLHSNDCKGFSFGGYKNGNSRFQSSGKNNLTRAKNDCCFIAAISFYKCPT